MRPDRLFVETLRDWAAALCMRAAGLTFVRPLEISRDDSWNTDEDRIIKRAARRKKAAGFGVERVFVGCFRSFRFHVVGKSATKRPNQRYGAVRRRLLLRLPPGDFCDLGFCWMSLASTASDALSAPPHLPRTVDLDVFGAKKRQAGQEARRVGSA